MTATTEIAKTTRRWRGRVLTIALAVLVAELAWVLAGPIGGVDLAVRNGDRLQEINAGNVLVGAIVPGLVAWVVVAILERRTARAAMAWTAGALISLALSLSGPLGSGDGTSTKLVLCGFHALVAAVLILGFRRTLRWSWGARLTVRDDHDQMQNDIQIVV